MIYFYTINTLSNYITTLTVLTSINKSFKSINKLIIIINRFIPINQLLVFIMKQLTLLLLILALVVAIAGCTSQNTGQNNEQNTALNSGSSGQSQIQSDIPNCKTSSTSSNPRYEATGLCYNVVDGDTIDVEGVGRVRFVGVNTPERGEPGYQSAKDFVKSMVEGKVVSLDIDDAKHYDKYDRTLAVVYIDNINLNQELLKRGYAEIMYIPPSEFNPYSWT